MQPTAQRIARAAVAGAVAVAGLTLMAAPAPEPAVPATPVQRPSGQPDFGLTPFGFNLGTFSLSPDGTRAWPGDVGVSPLVTQHGDLTGLPGAELPASTAELRN